MQNTIALRLLAEFFDEGFLAGIHFYRCKRMLLELKKARDGKHKYVAVFSNGKKVRFGAVGYEDYTTHKDKERRERYRDRHEKDLATQDPYRPGYLSYYLLWGDSTDLDTNVAKYNKMFF